MNIDMKKKETFVKNLLNWYSKNKRDFSWRNKTNPFHILVAEIMLQKTDAKKVSEVYDIFIERHPTPQDLVSAELSELKKELALLGIHKRAERMKKLAEKIIFEYGGEVPSEKEELLKLPGVGEYISNAVLCFAFGENVPIVDTNVIRLLDRVFGVKSSKSRPRTDRKIWEFAAELVPKGKCKEYNHALLDFAASVCTSKNPQSDICPEKTICCFAKEKSA